MWVTDSFNTRKKRLLAVLVLLGALLVIIFAGLPIYAVLWHIVHRAAVECGEYTIPVPTGWWARDGGCSLVTPLPKHSLLSAQAAQIFFNRVATPDVGDTNWRTDVLNQLQQRGETFEGTKELMVAGAPTICFQYRLPSDSLQSIAIACNVDRRMVVTFFYDDPKLAADFYQVLYGIRISAPSGP
jgi:hypothetical protein